MQHSIIWRIVAVPSKVEVGRQEFTTVLCEHYFSDPYGNRYEITTKDYRNVSDRLEKNQP